MRMSAKKKREREDENKNRVLKWKCWVHFLLYYQTLFPQRAAGWMKDKREVNIKMLCKIVHR